MEPCLLPTARPRGGPRPSSTASPPPPATGSRARSPRPRPRRRARGRRSPTGSTRWSWRPPARARRWPRSSGRSTGWPPSRRPTRPRTAAGCSTSRRSRRSPSTCSATCARRWPGIRQAAHRLGLTESRHHGRHAHRRHPRRRAAQFARTPPDVLVTTPESLFLLLTSAARESLRGVDTVIVDEVHAVPAPSAGRTWRCRWSGSTSCSTPRPSASGSRPPCARWTRSRRSSAGGPPGRGRQPADGEDDRRSRVEVPVPDLAALDERPAPGSADEEVDRLGGRRGAAAVDLARGGAARCSSWSASTARRSCSPTPGGWPSGSPRGSTSCAERATPRRTADAVELDDAGRGRAVAARVPGRGRRAVRDRRRGAGRSWPRRTTGRCRREQRTLVEEELKAGRAARAWWPRPAWSWASTWARSTSWCRSRRRRAWRPGCSGSGRAGPPGRRGVARAWCSRSTGATSCRAPWWPSGWPAARSSRCATRATRSTCSPSTIVAMVGAGAVVGSTTSPRVVRRAAPFAGAARLRAARRAGHARRALPVSEEFGELRAADHLGPGHRPAGRAAPARSGSRSPPAARSRTAGCSR